MLDHTQSDEKYSGVVMIFYRARVQGGDLETDPVTSNIGVDNLFQLSLTKEASVYKLLIHCEKPIRVTIWIHKEPEIVFPF